MEYKDYGTILKPIFKKGYVPSRDTSFYFGMLKNGLSIAKCVNCFGYACFNLLDQDLYDLDLSFKQSEQLFFPPCGDEYHFDKNLFLKNAFSMINETGLTIKNSPITEILKKNEWRVALYFKTDWLGGDYHFMLQKKKGWYNKMGNEEDLGYVFSNKPPNQFLDYYLHDTYKITNPFAENE